MFNPYPTLKQRKYETVNGKLTELIDDDNNMSVAQQNQGQIMMTPEQYEMAQKHLTMPSVALPYDVPVQTERITGRGTSPNPFQGAGIAPSLPFTQGEGIETRVNPLQKGSIPSPEFLIREPQALPNITEGIKEPVVKPDYSGMFPTYVPKPELDPNPAFGIPKTEFNVGSTMIDFTKPRINNNPISGTTIVDNTTGIAKPVLTPPDPIDSSDVLKTDSFGRPIISSSTGKPDSSLAEPVVNKAVPKPDSSIFTLPTPKTKSTTTPLPGEETTTTTKDEKSNNIANMYYAGKAILDGGALFNNMVQAPPPTMQLATPKYERMRLDRTPFENARTDVREAQVSANRGMREGMSQASDLMRGLSAVTAGTGEQMAGIGTQEAGAALQVEQQNQQIAMQESNAQNQIINQESQVNYQIQQAAQARKDELISTQLGRIGDTAGAYAKYDAMKEISKRQEDANKEDVLASNEIQSAMFEWQMSQNELTSDEYTNAELLDYKQKMSESAKELYGSEKYKDLRTVYGNNAPSMTTYTDKALDKDFMGRYSMESEASKNFERMYPGGAAPDPTKYTDTKQYEKAQETYQKVKESYDAYTNNSDYRTFEMEHSYWSEASKGLDRGLHKTEFADQYVKRKGLTTTEGLSKRLKAIMDRSRQNLER